jgi:hypothetical protein
MTTRVNKIGLEIEMPLAQAIHIARNDWGFSDHERRAARLILAAEVERLTDSFEQYETRTVRI